MSTQQTGGATPQTAATCKESLQVHAPDPRQQQAARLREMGKSYRRAAGTSRYHEKHCRADMFLASAELHSVDAESHEANAAALACLEAL